ncbi:MAG: NAD(P)H-hydrate dehydratase [Eubacterium sp.]|nr:NAD(P)H-hydrate dehydratase [Eubacterium sp.]
MSTIRGGTPSLILMERAAMAVVTVMQKHQLDLSFPVIFCGTGNNGGDGLAIARILADIGYAPVLIAPGGSGRFSEERMRQEDMLRPYGLMQYEYPEREILSRATVLIDAMFGTGLTRPLQDTWADCTEKLNDAASEGIPVVAVDMPSGIHTDTGQVLGTAVKADVTVALAALKPGMLLDPGRQYAGKTEVMPIGVRLPEADAADDAFTEKVNTHPGFLKSASLSAESSEPDSIRCRMRVAEQDLYAFPKRDETGNKGTFGKSLLITGSRTICGAAYLSAVSALRSGIGMAKIYTEESNRIPLAASLPEALISTYSDPEQDRDKSMEDCGKVQSWDAEQLDLDLDWADAILIGCGLGCGSMARRILSHVLEKSDKPLVLDADALNLLSEDIKPLKDYRGSCVITPHVLEMSRLTGKKVREIKADPCRAAAEFAAETGVTVLLKDAVSVAADPSGRVWIYADGCSALAAAGSGDVLAGLLCGLLTRFRKEKLPAAALAMCLHGESGRAAAERTSASAVLAGDLPAEFSGWL